VVPFAAPACRNCAVADLARRAGINPRWSRSSE
jgi:hypothetical protein